MLDNAQNRNEDYVAIPLRLGCCVHGKGKNHVNGYLLWNYQP